MRDVMSRNGYLKKGYDEYLNYYYSSNEGRDVKTIVRQF